LICISRRRPPALTVLGKCGQVEIDAIVGISLSEKVFPGFAEAGIAGGAFVYTSGKCDNIQ
jgi:hypothetical protein